MNHLSGRMICRLMRVHRKTIRGLSLAMAIPQYRVRYVRVYGVSGEYFVRDWLEALCKPQEVAK